jgi:FMN-dependent NADH-azoreductase
MKKILYLISSPHGATSFSIKLGNVIVEKLQEAFPGSTVKTIDLTKTRYPHLEEVHIQSFYTPAEGRSPELIEAIKHSDAAVADLKEADIIVIGVPMHNFSIPSTLKTWIDHIARSGQTFAYTATGIEGLVKNKKVYLAISSGGIYSDGPMKPYDFTESYLRALLGFLGMTDLTAYRVEGVNMPVIQDTALNKAIESIKIGPDGSPVLN